MTTEERDRTALRRRLEEVLGEEHATTLMSNLPAEELATKADLEREVRTVRTEMAAMEQRLNHRFEALEHRVTATFRKELIAQGRIYMLVTIAGMGIIGSLVVAAA